MEFPWTIGWYVSGPSLVEPSKLFQYSNTFSETDVPFAEDMHAATFLYDSKLHPGGPSLKRASEMYSWCCLDSGITGALDPFARVLGASGLASGIVHPGK